MGQIAENEIQFVKFNVGTFVTSHNRIMNHLMQARADQDTGMQEKYQW